MNIKTVALYLSVLLLSTGTMFGQKPDYRVKNYKDKASKHKKIALLPFQFAKKEYNSLPEGITEEIIASGEREKGLEFQQLLFEELSKKGKKYGHEWLSPEKLNAALVENGYDIMDLKAEDATKLCEVLGVDALVHSNVETYKLIVTSEKGSEIKWEDTRTLYGLSGNATYVNMIIQAKEDSEPYWRWKIKFNGHFKSPKLMISILEKNYIHDYFPYKY